MPASQYGNGKAKPKAKAAEKPKVGKAKKPKVVAPKKKKGNGKTSNSLARARETKMRMTNPSLGYA